MVRLTIDPWDPQYGGSVELDEVERVDEEILDLDVEEGEWRPREPEPPSALPRIAFVDGVRRVDVRLFAEANGETAPALAGSWAVGAAWTGDPPEIDSVRVGRELVVGGGLDYEDLVTEIGDKRLQFTYSGVAESSLTAPLQGLQNQMREAEGDLAHRILEAGQADMVVLDGPLTYFAERGSLLGLIKRQSRAYLPPEKATILRDLATGSRTPLFKIGEQRLERYAWYSRVARGREIEGMMTGIVRLEVSTQVGARRATELADASVAVLPRFASRSGHDPRAPQNLYPVGRLESVLRHRLGDPQLVRRAVEKTLWRKQNG